MQAPKDILQKPTAASWALLATVTSLVGVLFRERCRPSLWGATQDVLANGCYSDISSLYVSRGFISGVVPYADSFEGRFFEYPVLTGALVRLAQLAVGGIEDLTQRTMAFMYVSSLMLTACAAVMTYLLAHMITSRIVMALVAASPLLILLGAVNWDLAAAAVSVAGLWLWQRNRRLLAAICAGLGIAFKLWPMFLLAAFVFEALRRSGIRTAAGVLAAGIGAWLAVNLPIMILYTEGWATFFTFSASRGNDWGSVWTAVSLVSGWFASPSVQNLVGLAGMTLGSAIIAWRSWRSDASAALVTAAFVTIFILIGKAGAMQYSLWLLPLFALTVRRTSVFLAWQAVQVAFCLSVYGILLAMSTNGERGLSNGQFGVVVLLWHASNVAALAWAWREHEVRARSEQRSRKRLASGNRGIGVAIDRKQ